MECCSFRISIRILYTAQSQLPFTALKRRDIFIKSEKKYCVYYIHFFVRFFWFILDLCLRSVSNVYLVHTLHQIWSFSCVLKREFWKLFVHFLFTFRSQYMSWNSPALSFLYRTSIRSEKIEEFAIFVFAHLVKTIEQQLSGRSSVDNALY